MNAQRKLAHAEARADSLSGDSYQLYVYLLNKNPQLMAFDRKLYSDSAADAEQLMRYFIYEYPIIVGGEKGRQAHHHRFVIRDPSKAYLLKQRLFQDCDYFESYKFTFTDYQYFELQDYDNVRYIWENPLFYDEKHYGPRDFPGTYEKMPPKELGPALLVMHFRNTLDRSPDNLSALYNRFKLPFYKTVSPDLYKKLKLDVTVNGLLEGYASFAKQDLPRAATRPQAPRQRVQPEVDGEDGKEDAEQEELAPRTPRRHLSMSEAVAVPNRRWYRSFWDRRAVEGNVAVVLGILKDVQAHYTPAPAR